MNNHKRFLAIAVLAVLGLAALRAAASPSSNVVGWSTGFEPPAYTNTMPLIDGTNGWYGSSAEVMVQTNVVKDGEQAAIIPTDSSLTNRFVEESSNTNIWIQMDVMPVLDVIDIHPTVDTNAAALFYINSNGNFVVHDGPPTPSETNSVNWLVCDAVTIETNEQVWVRINIMMDYNNTNWTLYADNVLVTNDIGFVDDGVLNFAEFAIRNDGGTSYLDNVSVMEGGASVVPMKADHLLGALTGLDITLTPRGRALNQIASDGTVSPLVSNVHYTVDGDVYTILLAYLNEQDVSDVTLTFEMESGMDPTTVASIHGLLLGTNDAFILYDEPPSEEKGTDFGDIWVGYPATNIFVVTNALSSKITNITWTIQQGPGEDIIFSVLDMPTELEPGESADMVVECDPGSGVFTGRVEIVTEGDVSDVNSVNYLNLRATGHHIPVLGVDPLELSNEVSEGHKAGAQSFSVWNDSPAPRHPMPYNLEVVQGGDWIDVGPTNRICIGDDTNTVWITYNTDTAGLEPGVYTGIVAVALSDYSVGSTDVTVVMTVNRRPVLSLDLDGSWSNSISVGHSVPPETFEVWNGSAPPMGRLRYQVTDNMDWISLDNAGGTSTGEVRTVTVFFHTEDLSAGVYTGRITIVGTDAVTGDPADGSPQHLDLELNVRSDLIMATDLRDIRNVLLEGQIHTNTFLIWNRGNIPRPPMSYTVSADRGWMSVPAPTGVVTDGTNTVSVIFSARNLSPGTYTGSITADAYGPDSTRAAGAPLTRAAELVVQSRKPKNFELPEILGIPQVGQVLEVDNGLWQNENRLEFSYQWQRASTRHGKDLVNIAGANDKTYEVTKADRNGWLRVRVTAVDKDPTPLYTTVYSEFHSSSRIRVTPGDFSGDGKTDLWFYDPPYETWRIAYSDGGTAELRFGWWDTDPVPGDYDGSGVMDFAVYHQPEGNWYIFHRPSYQFVWFNFGWWETFPVVGDYDGDGITDVAVYWPEGGLWFIFMSSTWTVEIVNWGWQDTIPVPADYTGDGVTDIAVYYNGWWFIYSLAGNYWWLEALGGSDAIPVPGDYDGDGFADLAVYRSEENEWDILESSTGKVRRESFGTSAGRGFPAPGYYDSDNRLDLATMHVWGDKFIVWSVQRSSEEPSYKGQSYQTDIDMWRVNW